MICLVLWAGNMTGVLKPLVWKTCKSVKEMGFNSHSWSFCFPFSFLLHLSLLNTFSTFFYQAFCLTNSQFCSCLPPLRYFHPHQFPNMWPPPSACKIQFLPQPLSGLSPFCPLWLNSLPPKKRQIIKVELRLAKATSELKGAALPFKNSQEIVNFLKTKIFHFWLSTELLIAQRVSSTTKYFEMYDFSFAPLFMTYSILSSCHGKLKIAKCIGPWSSLCLCSDCPECATWNIL